MASVTCRAQLPQVIPWTLRFVTTADYRMSRRLSTVPWRLPWTPVAGVAGSWRRIDFYGVHPSRMQQHGLTSVLFIGGVSHRERCSARDGRTPQNQIAHYRAGRSLAEKRKIL